jgi:hypothetical protein
LVSAFLVEWVGRRHIALSAAEEKWHVGYFLRLPVAQCGKSGQDGAEDKVWDVGGRVAPMGSEQGGRD